MNNTEMRGEKKYLDCHFLKNSIHFFYDNIRACCSNALGPIFYDKFQDENIDTDYMYEVRKKYIERINNDEFADGVPDCCKNCCEIDENLKTEKIKEFENKVQRIYFQNTMSCNAKCTYCTFRDVEKGYKYKVVPIIKAMIEKKILAKDAYIFMSGGEITIYPEFEELFSILFNYLESCIEIFSSGIKYLEIINEAFKKNRCRMVISLDSGCRETYLKIKQVDCFEQVVNNVAKYTSSSENAKEKIVLKYILVDDVNDNKEEIEKFIKTVVSLGVKNVRMDVDYEKYKYSFHNKVPEHYFELFDYFYELSAKNELTIEKCVQSEKILEYSRT